MGTDCDKLTVCIRCKHYRVFSSGEYDGVQLSAQCCAASVKNRVDNVDLVTGEENHYNTYHYCDEINNGHCPKYERCSVWKDFERIDHIDCCLNVVLVILLIVLVVCIIGAVLFP